MEDPIDRRGATRPGQRRVTLTGGAELAVRPVTADDVDGLAELCASLCDEDRYRRFFSGYTPDRTFFERAAQVEERGGFGLVAVVTGGPAGDDEVGEARAAGRTGHGEEPAAGRVVGEAGYELLPNGDGELAMMVAPDWRGWLGPYLLDALVEAAAARGVPNIEADVLATNRPMLELLRSRGYAVMPSDDWVSLRLIVGTAGRTPVWPEGHERPRVLVEVPGGRWHAAAEAKEAGLEVIACSGPRGPRTRCPALAGEPCPLVAGADAVVVSHAPDDARWDRLVESHELLHPGVPVCIEHRRGARGVPAGTGAGPIVIDGGEAGGEDAGDSEKLVVEVVDRLARAHARGRPSGGPQSPLVEGVDSEDRARRTDRDEPAEGRRAGVAELIGDRADQEDQQREHELDADGGDHEAVRGPPEGARPPGGAPAGEGVRGLREHDGHEGRAGRRERGVPTGERIARPPAGRDE